MEAAVVQWTWLQDVASDAEQFNSLHDRLIAKWRDIAPYLKQPVHLASADTEEDVLTVVYLRDTAEQAGLQTAQLLLEEIGWSSDANCFVDLENEPIRSLFKLYPWESLLGLVLFFDRLDGVRIDIEQPAAFRHLVKAV